MPNPECKCGSDCPGRTDSGRCHCGCQPGAGEEPKPKAKTAAETVLTTPDKDQPSGAAAEGQTTPPHITVADLVGGECL